MHVSKSRRPLKPCFVEQCPHCRSVGEFWLIELAGSVAIFGGVGYSVSCIRCGFEKLLSNADAGKMAAVAEHYARLLAGGLTLNQFDRELEGAGLKAVREIRNEARVWVCGTCNEENPLNFESCWKCGAQSPHPPDSKPAPPRLPDLGGGYAWEK